MERIKDPGRIAIYTRVSKQGGVREDAARQEELCRQYGAARFGCPESGMQLYADGPGARRIAYDRLLAHVRGEWVDVILCWGLDRICRSVREFAQLMQELEKHGVSLVAVSDHVDTSTSLGAMLLYAAAALEKLEREGSAERVRGNMQELARTGRWLGGVTPTGYLSRPETDGRSGRKAFLLVVEPQEAEVVRMIFARFLECHSLSKTEAHLKQLGMKTKNGRDFSRFTVRQILENPVYAAADAHIYAYFNKLGAEINGDAAAFNGTHGVMAYNKTMQKYKQTNKPREVTQWIVTVGHHEALLSGTEWVTAQELLGQNKNPDFRKPRSDYALLPGILFCGECGAHMRPKLTQRRNADGELIYTYLCEQKEKTKGRACDVRNISGNKLDKAVCAQLSSLAYEDIPLLAHADEAEQELETGGERLKAQRNACDAELAEKEKAVSALVLSLTEAKEQSGHGYVLKQLEALHAEIAWLKEQIAALDDMLSEHPLLPVKAQMARELLDIFRENPDSMSVEQKRATLRTFIERVEWNGQNMYIYLRENAY